MTTIAGGKAHLKQISSLARAGRNVSKELFVASDIIRTEAVLSITQGSVSGAGHVPSAPGEAPNADTNTLDNSIHVRKVSDAHYEVVANAPYAVAQEYGTADGRLPERPYMRPAAAVHGDKAVILIKTAINRAAKGA